MSDEEKDTPVVDLTDHFLQKRAHHTKSRSKAMQSRDSGFEAQIDICVQELIDLATVQSRALIEQTSCSRRDKELYLMTDLSVVVALLKRAAEAAERKKSCT